MPTRNPRLLYSLLKPAAFLQVRHPTRGRLALLSLGVGLFAAVVAASARELNIIGPNGLVAGINGLFQALPGFYIAALAAIATFDGAKKGYDLDQVWPEPSPWMIDPDGAERHPTRRHFLALLFGYLSFSSLMLYLIGVFATVAAPFTHSECPTWLPVLRVAFAGLYTCWLAHIIGTTCLGLYFLAHRFHAAPAPFRAAAFLDRQTRLPEHEDTEA